MADLTQDRIVRKEVSLGAVREILPPMGHIGTALVAPFKEVQSDDVIFSYISPEVDGLAPARAEDAESELADKDDTVGTGRASVVDWAIKDHYDASDVTRYREFLRLAELAASGGSFPLTIGSMTEDFATKVAGDTKRRRRKLDNRLEWMIFRALSTGVITYAAGKIKFNVDFERPADQQAQAPDSGDLWSLTTADPVGDFIAIDDFMWDTHSIRMGKAIGSRKAWNAMLNSDRFAARSGLTGATGGVPVDPRYLIDGWGLDAVLSVFERQTGITPIIYDSVYRTRAAGSKVTVNNRFLEENRIVVLPKDEFIAEASDNEIGFAKTLTSPHPEGQWSSGYYEWERSTVDPWGQDIGTGIKAFPVFPLMEYTYTVDVLA